MTKIGFIGLGNMGLPMAGNLVKAGHQVKGFDMFAASLEKAAALGVGKAASAADAAKDADIVLTMLPAGKDTLAVYEKSGVMAAAKPGTLFVDSSTIDVGDARRAHEIAKVAKMRSLDAPVSGGVIGAEAASLTFMVGGPKEAFDRARPVLEAMGKKIVHCGDPGAGQGAKICNNMLAAISMIGACEAFALGEKLGLSHKALFDVLSTSSGQCWAVNNYCPVPELVPASPANKGYKAGFASALMWKDLKLSQAASAASGALTPMGAAAAQLYAMHNAAGDGGMDFSAIIHLIRGKGK